MAVNAAKSDDLDAIPHLFPSCPAFVFCGVPSKKGKDVGCSFPLAPLGGERAGVRGYSGYGFTRYGAIWT